MANFIPKITYNELNTETPKEITFNQPPEGDPFGETHRNVVKHKRSSSGVRQTQFQYSLKQYDIEFIFETETVKDQMLDFINNHAARGGQFEYFPSSDEIDSETFEYSQESFKLGRPIPDVGGTDFQYDFKFKIEKVEETTGPLLTFNTKSWTYDGINKKHTVAHDASIDITTEMTVGMWVKGAAGTAATLNNTFISKSLDPSQYGWWMRKHNDKLAVAISTNGIFNGGSAKRYYSSITCFDGSWHHVAFTFKANVLKLFIDGVEDTSPTLDVNGTVNTLHSNPTVDLILGANNNGINGFYPGQIDEAWVNAKALTPANITTIYNGGSSSFNVSIGPESATLAAYWRMGDSSGDTTTFLEDKTANANNGVGVNFITADIVTDVA